MNDNTYRKFDEIQYAPLQAYNRTVTMFNLHSDFGPESAREYLHLFTHEDKVKMEIIAKLIQSRGTKWVQDLIRSECSFEDDLLIDNQNNVVSEVPDGVTTH